MKTEHTKGPWIAHSAYFFGHDSFQITGRNGDSNPFLCRLTDDTPNFEANARLIAAAPELLEALYAALPCVEESEEFDKPNGPKLSVKIRALLAQAEGNA